MPNDRVSKDKAEGLQHHRKSDPILLNPDEHHHRFSKSFGIETLAPFDINVRQLETLTISSDDPKPSKSMLDHLARSIESIHLVPQVQEVNGSSDSQQQQQQQQQSQSIVSSSGLKLSRLLGAGASTKSLVDGKNMDRELQEAVDLMLQGRSSAFVNHSPPLFPRTYYNNIALNSMGPPRSISTFVPGSLQSTVSPGASGIVNSMPTGQQRRSRAARRGNSIKAVGQRLRKGMAGRLAKYRHLGYRHAHRLEGDLSNSDSSYSPAFSSISEVESPKRKRSNSRMRGIPEKKSKTYNDNDLDAYTNALANGPSAVPKWVPRFLHPLVRYIQRRPMTALGILLAILILFLVVLVVILVVAVFPFLLRSTLEDVSFAITSLHAVPPPDIGRALSSRTDHGPHAAMFKRDFHPQQHERRSKLHAAKAMHTAIRRVTYILSSTPPHLHPAHTTSNRIHSATGNRDLIVASKTSHVQPTPTDPVDSALGITSMLKGAAALSSATYMMRVSGNLTSGGPLGVDIEFTEPLRLLWRDVEVGVIEHPESIHVPGRGTVPWKWPPIEVRVPGTEAANKNKKLEITHGQSGGMFENTVTLSDLLKQKEPDDHPKHMYRNDLTQDSLTSWLAAIQAHTSFTMLWKSRVKVSAMGMHASNIKFEKTVRIECNGSKNCSITSSLI